VITLSEIPSLKQFIRESVDKKGTESE